MLATEKKPALQNCVTRAKRECEIFAERLDMGEAR